MLEMAKNILSTLWSICRLQKGPEHLPPSVTVLVIVGLLYIISNSVLGLLISLLFIWLLLKYYKLEERYVQTAIALVGAMGLINLIFLPISFLFPMPHSTTQITLSMIFIVITSLICVGWMVAVASHIYSRTLNVSFSKGLLIAFIYLVFVFMIALLFAGFSTAKTGVMTHKAARLYHPGTLNHG